MSKPNLFSSIYNKLRSENGLSARPLFRRYDDTYTGVCLDMLIALAPSLFWGVYAYGTEAAVLFLVSALSGALGELLLSFVLQKKPSPALFFSSALAGLLCGMMMPASESPIICAAISFVASFVFCELFRVLHLPALCPQAASFALFALIYESLSEHTYPLRFFEDGGRAIHPLTSLVEGSMPSEEWYDLLFGKTAGPIGILSAFLIIIGGIYLVVRRLADLRISVSFLASAALVTYLCAGVPNPFAAIGCVLSSGMTMFGALFLAPQMTCAPRSKTLRYIYGALCGTAFVYLTTLMPSSPILSLSLSVLIGNATARIFDLVAPTVKPFGMMKG